MHQPSRQPQYHRQQHNSRQQQRYQDEDEFDVMDQAPGETQSGVNQEGMEQEEEAIAVKVVKLLQSMQEMDGKSGGNTLDEDGSGRVKALTAFTELFIQDPTQAISFVPYLLNFDDLSSLNDEIKMILIKLIEHSVCRSPSSPIELRNLVLIRGIHSLGKFLMNPSIRVKKRAVLCVTNIYPEAIRYLFLNPHDQSTYSFMSAMTAEILNFLAIKNDGLRIYVAKFLIKQVIVKSAKGTQDELDVSSDLCPIDHPFMRRDLLGVEAAKLMEPLLGMLHTARVSVSVMVSVITSLLFLVNRRHQFVQPVLEKFVVLVDSAPVGFNHLSKDQKRDLLRTLKLVLLSFYKLKDITSFKSSISDTLKRLNNYIEKNDSDFGRTAGLQSLHPDDKEGRRARLLTASERAHYLSSSILKSIDITKLPVPLVVDVIISALQNASYLDLKESCVKLEQQRLSAEQSRIVDVARDPRRKDPRFSSVSKEAEAYMYRHPAIQPFLNQVLEVATRINQESGAVAAEMSEDIFSALVHDEIEARMAPPMILDGEQKKAVFAEAIARILKAGDSLFADTPAPSTNVATNTVGAAKTAWMQMVSKLTGPDRFLLGSAQSESLGDSVFTAVNQETKEVLVNFILQDFRERYEFAVLWLHQEMAADDKVMRAWKNLGCHGPQPIREYPHWFHKILEALHHRPPADTTTPTVSILDPMDRTFTKFLIDVPELTDHAIQNVLRAYCFDLERMQLGIASCRDLIKLKPAVEDPCFALLMELCIHGEKAIRATAIITVKRFFADHAKWGSRVEEMALKYVQSIQELPPLQQQLAESGEGDAVMKDANGSSEMMMDTAAEEGAPAILDANGNPVSAAKDAMEDKRAVREAELSCRLELYLTLCAKKPRLLSTLFEVFARVDSDTQDVIKTHIQGMLSTLLSHGLHIELASVLPSIPQGAEPLMHRMMVLITENYAPPVALVSAVKSVIASRQLDARYLVPILPGLNKAEIILNLPAVVDLLDATEAPRALIKGVFIRLVEASKNVLLPHESGTKVAMGAALDPVELLVQLHVMEDAVDLKKMIEGITICLTTPTLFTQQVLAAALQRLLTPESSDESLDSKKRDEEIKQDDDHAADGDRENGQHEKLQKRRSDQAKSPLSIPTLFMRTLIQSITLFPALDTFAVTALSQLISRKVWTDGRAWEGFVRCCTHLFPKSLTLLTTLPVECSRDALRRSVKLREALTAYLVEADAAGGAVMPGMPSVGQRKALRRLLEGLLSVMPVSAGGGGL